MQRHLHHIGHLPTQLPSHPHFYRYLDSAIASPDDLKAYCRHILSLLKGTTPNYQQIVSTNTTIPPLVQDVPQVTYLMMTAEL